MKRCPKCGEHKTLDGFSKDRTRRDGLCVWCKECTKKNHVENREREIARSRKWRIENPDRVRENSTRWVANNPKKFAEIMYKGVCNRRARKKGSSGKISIEEWKSLKEFYNYTCLRCGQKEPKIKLTMDHVVPLSLGGKHAIDNVQPLCRSCNSKKSAEYIDYRTNRMVVAKTTKV